MYRNIGHHKNMKWFGLWNYAGLRWNQTVPNYRDVIGLSSLWRLLRKLNKIMQVFSMVNFLAKSTPSMKDDESSSCSNTSNGSTDSCKYICKI